MVTFDDHMNPLHDITFPIVAESEDTLEAENIGAELLCDLVDPRKEALRVKFTCTQRDAADRLVVPVVHMVVLVAVVLVLIAVVVISAAVMALEESRFERQDAVEIEGSAIEHPIERQGNARCGGSPHAG